MNEKTKRIVYPILIALGVYIVYLLYKRWLASRSVVTQQPSTAQSGVPNYLSGMGGINTGTGPSAPSTVTDWPPPPPDWVTHPTSSTDDKKESKDGCCGGCKNTCNDCDSKPRFSDGGRSVLYANPHIVGTMSMQSQISALAGNVLNAGYPNVYEPLSRIYSGPGRLINDNGNPITYDGASW